MWLEVIARQASQREIADRWRVDRSTVVIRPGSCLVYVMSYAERAVTPNGSRSA